MLKIQITYTDPFGYEQESSTIYVEPSDDGDHDYRLEEQVIDLLAESMSVLDEDGKRIRK